MWQERFVRSLLRHRLLVLLVVGAISLVGLFFTSRLHFDASIEIWFLEDSPDLVTYRSFLKRFEGDELVVLGVFGQDVFSPDSLAALERLTQGAENASFVLRARSLTNTDIIRSDDGMLEIAPLIDDLPQSAEEAAALRERALSNPLLVENLVSRNGQATALLIEIDSKHNDATSKSQLVGELRQLVREAREKHPDLHFAMAGTPVFDDAFFRYSEEDSMTFAPLMVLIVVVLTFVLFRRFSASLVPLSVVVLALVWTFGLMGALGVQLNVVSVILMPLILAVGVADSIHVLSDYYREMALGDGDKDEAIVRSVAHLLMPCFFTSATTSAGMLSLLVSSLKPVREFGWLAAFGVSAAFILSLTFLPLVLYLAKSPDPDFLERQRHGRFNQFLEWLGRPTLERSRLILGLSGGLVLWSVFQVLQLNIGANPMNYFRTSDPMRQATEQVDRDLGGSTSVELLVEVPEERLKDPDLLSRLEQLQRETEEKFQGSVTRTLSVVDSLVEMNRVFNDEDPAYEVLPDNQPMIAQFYLLLEGEDDFKSMVQENYSVGRVTIRVNMSKAQDISGKLPWLENRIAELFPEPDVRVEVTGFIKLMGEMEHYLLDSQQKSFIVAFIVVTLMMMLLLRSVRLGLLSLIPNLLPILVGMGVMSYFGVALDPGTVMIGSIALGLVVDDTVHFLTRLKRLLTVFDGDLEAAILGAMRETGRPIVMTTVVLAAGFSVMILAHFTPNLYFGVFSGLVILLALLADLLMLPAVLLVVRPKI